MQLVFYLYLNKLKTNIFWYVYRKCMYGIIQKVHLQFHLLLEDNNLDINTRLII